MRGLLLTTILYICSVKAQYMGSEGNYIYAITDQKSNEVMSIVAQVQGTSPKMMPTEVAVPFSRVPLDSHIRAKGPTGDDELTTHTLITNVLRFFDKQENKEREAGVVNQQNGVLAWRQSVMSSRPIDSIRKPKTEEEEEERNEHESNIEQEASETHNISTSESKQEASEAHNERRSEPKPELSRAYWTTKTKEHKLEKQIKKGAHIYNKIFNAMLLRPEKNEPFFKPLSDAKKLHNGKLHPEGYLPQAPPEPWYIGHKWDNGRYYRRDLSNQHYRRDKWNNCTEDHDYVHGCSDSHTLQKYISVVKDDDEFRNDLRELFAKLRKGDRMKESPRHECKERGDAKLCISWSWPTDLGWSLYHVEKMIKDVMRCRVDDTAFPSGQFKWTDLHEKEKNWRTVCVSDREKGCTKDYWFCPTMDSGRETYKQRDDRKKFKAEFGYPRPDRNHPSPDGKYY